MANHWRHISFFLMVEFVSEKVLHVPAQVDALSRAFGVVADHCFELDLCGRQVTAGSTIVVGWVMKWVT